MNHDTKPPVLCFDIGGSRIKAARAEDGLLDLGEVATPVDDFDAFVAALRGFHAGEQRVAVSIAGIVDPDSGRSKVANIACLDGRAVAADLTKALGVPVLVMNDADCFALAEALAAPGKRVVFAIILGTGVGGGLVLNGQLVSGAGGYVGEWGHGPVIEDPALPCGCGLIGCLETVGSARGLERLHLHLTGRVASAAQILADWRAGEAVTVTRWLRLVGGHLAMAINLLGADHVPVGGGLSNDRDLIAALDQTVRGMILRRSSAPLVVPAAVSADAGLIGAAAALRRLVEIGAKG